MMDETLKKISDLIDTLVDARDTVESLPYVIREDSLSPRIERSMWEASDHLAGMIDSLEHVRDSYKEALRKRGVK